MGDMADWINENGELDDLLDDTAGFREADADGEDEIIHAVDCDMGEDCTCRE